MGKFTVQGADRETGEPKTLTIEATDAKDAERIAHAVGLVVRYSVQSKSDPPASESTNSESSEVYGVWPLFLLSLVLPPLGAIIGVLRIGTNKPNGAECLLGALVGFIAWTGLGAWISSMPR